MSKYEPDHDDRALEDAFIRWQAEQYSDAGTLMQSCPPEEVTDKTDYRTADELIPALTTVLKAVSEALHGKAVEYPSLDGLEFAEALAVLGEGRGA